MFAYCATPSGRADRQVTDNATSLDLRKYAGEIREMSSRTNIYNGRYAAKLEGEFVVFVIGDADQSFLSAAPHGDGKQGVYLTELPAPLAEVLAGLIGSEATPLMRPDEITADSTHDVHEQSGDDLDTWEHVIETQIETDTSVRDTEKTALIRARRGQGLFKDRVAAIESHCRITGVDNSVHLVASHCKPWRDSNNEERLDGENGTLASPVRWRY